MVVLAIVEASVMAHALGHAGMAVLAVAEEEHCLQFIRDN